jgi:transposase
VKIDSIDVEAAINNARELINSESDLSPALRFSIEVLLLVITLVFNRITLNSKNSSKPPVSDPNRLKSSRAKSSKPLGAQLGHVDKTLEKVKS